MSAERRDLGRRSPGVDLRTIVLGGLVLASIVGVVLGALFGGLEGGGMVWPLSWVMWAPAGGLILVKRPGNGVGVTMLAVGVLWGISFACLALAASTAAPQIQVWAELVNVIFGAVPWLGIVWMITVFPTGRLDGRLERLIAGALIGLGVFATLAFSLSTVPMESTGLPSPMSVPLLEDLTRWFVAESGFLLVLFLLGLSIVSLARRWTKSSGAERHQYRWLLLGTLVFGVILAVSQVLPDDSKALYTWVLAGAAIPVTVGVAVSRYRLFEIDRVISRTVSYTALIVLLGALFGLVVVGMPNWIPRIDDSPLLVAVATLGVAALFNPLRRRVHLAVDRRFNRSRYDAQRVMDEFAERLQEQLDAGSITQGWAQVVSDTMQPASAGIWMRT